MSNQTIRFRLSDVPPIGKGRKVIDPSPVTVEWHCQGVLVRHNGIPLPLISSAQEMEVTIDREAK